MVPILDTRELSSLFSSLHNDQYLKVNICPNQDSNLRMSNLRDEALYDYANLQRVNVIK